LLKVVTRIRKKQKKEKERNVEKSGEINTNRLRKEK
jgi:hypothetical protein